MTKSKSTRAKAAPSAGVSPARLRLLLDSQYSQLLRARGIVGCAMNAAATKNDWAEEIADALEVALEIFGDVAIKLDPSKNELLQEVTNG